MLSALRLISGGFLDSDVMFLKLGDGATVAGADVGAIGTSTSSFVSIWIPLRL